MCLTENKSWHSAARRPLLFSQHLASNERGVGAGNKNSKKEKKPFPFPPTHVFSLVLSQSVHQKDGCPLSVSASKGRVSSLCQCMKRTGVLSLSVHEKDGCPLSASASKGRVSSLCQCIKRMGVLSLSVHEKDGCPLSVSA